MQEADERDWNELEARYREECAALLGDARRHLEQRVAGEQAKIENALAGFSRDFDAWLARERRGEASPKPNLSTLFEIWLERAPRSSDAAAERAKRRAAEAEAEALRDRLGAETARAEELGRRRRGAEAAGPPPPPRRAPPPSQRGGGGGAFTNPLFFTSEAADEEDKVSIRGGRVVRKKNNT
ncbi:hypothetical protein A8B73_10500 [Methylosinus sp. 3S-1]|nr:hypothetical protein A8B73_10500 [Methylosinus sp. 3S-1]